MPNISVSYDAPPPAPVSPPIPPIQRPIVPPTIPAPLENRRVRPDSASEATATSVPGLPPLPALPSVPSARAPTVPGRPLRPDALPTPMARQALATEPVRAMRVAVPEPIRAERGSAGIAPMHIVQDGIVEVPIADTISGAVEAITQPEGSEDSVIASFDELVPPPSVPRTIRPPTEEEVLRLREPTTPPLSEIPEPPDDTGDFSTTPPLRVLFRLMTARATGLLVVAVGGVKKDIYVRDGMPEYVSSNIASELFGNYLVGKGVLSDGELAMALAMTPHYGGKLGDTLVGLGLLKPLEVFRHLTRQVRTKIIDVCSWNKGTFGWYAGRENPREAFPLDFNAFEILGAGAMAMPDDHIETWIERYGQVRLRATRTRRVGPERFEVLGLVELCELLDGRRSVSDLVQLYPERVERLRVGRMLCLLEACDLARPS